MSWEEPSVEQLRQILARATSMPDAEIDRVVRIFDDSAARRKLVRWGDLDREFARRALRHARRAKR